MSVCYVLAMALCLLGLTLRNTEGKQTQTVFLPGEECYHLNYDVDAVRLMHTSLQTTKFLQEEGCYKMEADHDRIIIKWLAAELGCDQKIELYYNTRPVGDPDEVVTCGSSPPTYYSTGKYLTVVFKPGSSGSKFNFSLVATSYNEDSFCGFGETECSSAGYICVDDDVKCDGILNCPNGDDEDFCAGIDTNDFVETIETVQGVALGVVIAIIVVSILACIGCIVGIVYCVRRQRSQPGRVIQPPTQNVVVQPVPGAPGQQPAPYYPVGTQAPPPGGYAGPPPQGGYAGAPPPGYPGAAPPPGYPQAGGYQPVPAGPPPGDPAAGGYPQQTAYPAQASAPPPPDNQPVQYNTQSDDVKVPL